MENLDVKTLFLAVTEKQAESILSGSYAMPEESSGRFGRKWRQYLEASTSMSGICRPMVRENL